MTGVIAPFRGRLNARAREHALGFESGGGGSQVHQALGGWREDGKEERMNERDGEAGRRTDGGRDGQTLTGIILCVILNWRVRAQRERERERRDGPVPNFSHRRVVGAKNVVTYVFLRTVCLR